MAAAPAERAASPSRRRPRRSHVSTSLDGLAGRCRHRSARGTARAGRRSGRTRAAAVGRATAGLGGGPQDGGRDRPHVPLEGSMSIAPPPRRPSARPWRSGCRGVALQGDPAPERTDSRSRRPEASYPSGKSRRPRPWTAGYTNSRYSSTRPARMSACVRLMLPVHTMSLPSVSFSPDLLGGVTREDRRRLPPRVGQVEETTYFCTWLR